jgi:DNA-binding LytR/AlgR family response regulator
MLRRRPDGLNGTIRYMQMEDHYLRVHTDEGAGLTLHRMADAVEDLAESDGLQVHKSWWIAHAAVAEVRQIGRRRVLVATDGAEVPVGRSFEPTLRAAGWF